MLQQRLFSPMSKFLLFILMVLLLPVSQVQAGVVIGGTRFIYNAKMTTLSVPVSNTTSESWLIDSHIQSAQRWPGGVVTPGGQPPFVITPPLFRLAAGQENTLRVTWTGDSLPVDRESLFTLSIAAIPSGKPGVNSLQMAFRSALKLIYRPSGLAGEPQQAYRQLRWTLTREDWRCRTPVLITSRFSCSILTASLSIRRASLPLFQRAKPHGASRCIPALCAGKASMIMVGCCRR